jgi:TPR repeat protein
MPEFVESNYSGVYKRALELYSNKKFKDAFKMLDTVVENDKSNINAHFLLGECYFDGKGIMKDERKAFNLYYYAAQNKHVEACYKTGLCYLNAIGVRQDYTQAVAWFNESAKVDHSMSQYYLGMAYMDGIGITKDIPRAVVWLVQASKANIVDAQKNAGICFEKLNKLRQAATMYLAAAENGDPYAMERIADFYADGKIITKCDELANKFYEEASNKGNCSAQNKLAYRYYNGDGIEKTLNRAVYWWMKASAGNIADAQNRLATLYFAGEGVIQDVEHAVLLWKKAAENGNIDAVITLAKNYSDDSIVAGGNQDECKYWWTKAAEAGVPMAMYKLGECFEYGIGMSIPNLYEAYRWYKLAADNDYKAGKAKVKTFKTSKKSFKKIK